MQLNPYNNLSEYLRRKYGQRLKKICIDGGFTCPNRDGKCGTGGCIYCGARGAGEHILPSDDIPTQVKRALRDADESDGFIAYFQSFTGTYGSPDSLRRKYDSALTDERIKVLAIATRPDCIDEEIAELISEYKSRVDVWVELGLQSSSDITARTINRGYTTDVFDRAVELLWDRGIPVVAHIIIGLPGEDRREVIATVKHVNATRVWGVKIHSMYVMKGTALEDMYLRGEYSPLEMDEYVSLAAESIRHLRPDITVHRITGDCQRELLVAPEWNTRKTEVIAKIQAELKNAPQGSLYEGK